MRATNPRTFTLFCAICLIAAALIVPATAETVTLTFQDIGLVTQQIDVFDDTGAYVLTTNRSSVVGLNVSESNRYTLQLNPTIATVEPVSLLDTLVAWLTQNILVVVIVLVLILAAGGLFRRR
jgi:hypothetical protein